MKLEIKGVLGLDRAEIGIEEGKITLLAGSNAQGKSSAIHAAAAALLPRAFPTGTTKSGFGKQMVNAAHKEGYVKFMTERGTRRVSYPKGEIHTLDGTGIHCDEWACQERQLYYLDPNARAKALQEIAKTSPTRERIRQELKDLKIDADKLEQLISTAIDIGFDVAQKTAEGWAKEMKGEFKAMTTFQWGSDQGITFKPAGWTDDLETADREQLLAVLVARKGDLDDAVGRAALYKAAGDKDKLAEELQQWTEKLAGYDQSISDARSLVEKSQRQSETVTCSGCGLEGIVEHGKLEKRPQAKSSTSLADAQKKLRDAEAGRNNAQMALGIAKSKFDNADGMGEPVDTEEPRANVDKADVRLKAFDAKFKGTELHYKIIDMLKAAEIVSPDGLPKTALLEGVKDLNDKLRKICEIAEWGIVEIDRDLNLRYDGKPYHPHILSKSERFRCDTTFQVLWACLKRHEIILIDEVDLLDGNGRNGLFSMLAHYKVTALVGMTVIGDAPNLGAAGIGSTYVVERGVARNMQEAVTA